MISISSICPCITSQRNRRGPPSEGPPRSHPGSPQRSQSRRDEAEHGPSQTAPGSSAPLGPLLPDTKFCAAACFHLLKNDATLAVLTNIPREGNRSEEV